LHQLFVPNFKKTKRCRRLGALLQDMVSALQNETLEEMWPDASIELSNLVQGVHHYAPSPVASPPRPSLPRQEEKYSPHKEEEEHQQEDEEEHFDHDDDPLADICTLLQAAGDRGVDLNRWLNHYDKTGTGVLRRQDLHRAVTSLGLGVSVGESEYDEQTAERALSQHSFDSLVEYLGAPSNSDIVPYARLLTMVPSLMETRRGDIRSPTRPSGHRSSSTGRGNRYTNEQISPNRGNVLLHNTKPLSATSPGGLAWTLEQGQTTTPADAARARVRSSQKKKRQLLQLQKTQTKEGLPMDVQATLGQQRARERVRERVRLEKLKVKKEKTKKLQVIKNKKKIKCDTVTLTGKMRKVSAKRKQKKTKKAAKQAAKLLEIANATSLDDLLRSKLTSRTTFGHLLNKIKKITTPNGVTQDRVSLTTMGLTTLLQDVIGLKLPLKSSEQLMKNILLLARQEGLDTKDEVDGGEETVTETETQRTKGGASSSSSGAVMRAPTLACEKYFRRVRCEHRIDYGGWYQNKTNAYDKDMKRLRKTVQQCLKGDVVALGTLKVEATLLEKNARLVLGEDPKAVADAMGESEEDVHGSSSGSGGTKPTRRTTRMRKELRTHHILPQWQVLAEAERITSAWLLSLEGRAAVRHAAWAAINRGKPMDAAVEPDAGALAGASKTLRGQRLTTLLDSKDGEDGGTAGAEGGAGGARGGGSPFYEMLSHKLFGEYLRETLVSAEEWKKTKMKMNNSGNSGGGSGGRVGSFPRRPFSEWLEKRSEQEKRNRETVEQWRKHKRRQFGEKLIQTKKIASVDAVLSQLSALGKKKKMVVCCAVLYSVELTLSFFSFCVEQAGYQEVAEKSGFGKMRKSARQGIHFLEKKKRIKEMGQVNAMEAAREEQANHNNNNRYGSDSLVLPTLPTLPPHGTYTLQHALTTVLLSPLLTLS